MIQETLHRKTKKRSFGEFFLSTTSWVVWVSILLTAAMMVLQRYLHAGAAPLPQETMAWGLIVIAGGYTGMDRFANMIKSRTLEYGEADLGDPKKLRWVLICLFILIVEALILQVFLNVQGLALETLIVAFSASGGAYVVGNKAIAASAFKGPSIPKVPEDSNAKGTSSDPTTK